MDPTSTHLPVFDKLLRERQIKHVLEFGCGLFSTKRFLDHGCNLTSIEMQNDEWAFRVKAEMPAADVRIALGAFEWRELELADRYDLIFVDGHADSRPDCLEWAKDHSDLIVAHDTEHPYYQWERADMSGFAATVHKGLSPWTTVWERIK